jgi:hypothetical protein
MVPALDGLDVCDFTKKCVAEELKVLGLARAGRRVGWPGCGVNKGRDAAAMARNGTGKERREIDLDKIIRGTGPRCCEEIVLPTSGRRCPFQKLALVVAWPLEAPSKGRTAD